MEINADDDIVDGPAAQAYRLRKIDEIQKSIEDEVKKRTLLCDKYTRHYKRIEWVDGILSGLIVGLGITSVTIVSTGIAAPIAIGTTSVMVGVGILNTIAKIVNRKLSVKMEKHDKIKVLAEARLNTMSGLISKALNDDQISEEEYSMILKELMDFDDEKEKIRSEARSKINTDDANEDIMNELRNISDKYIKHKHGT